MRILLAGGSGAIGVPLVRLLRERDHSVVAIHRASEGRGRLLTAGAVPAQVDVLDRPAMLDALKDERFDAVISELTSLKKPPVFHRDMAPTDRLRVEGTANLVEAATRCGARRFLTQSIVLGYGFKGTGDRIVTEDQPFARRERGSFESHLAAMRSNEDQVLGSVEFEGVALRYGLFYGPGPAGDALVGLLRRRRLPVARPAGVRPWLYIDDAVTATVAALERAGPGHAYNIVDDEPVSFTQLIQAIAEAIGAPKPLVVPEWMFAVAPYARSILQGDMRVSNALAKSELGWQQAVPNYREGVARMAGHYAQAE
jgi:nucleoside-diphosphate-sugar epimerase